MSATLWTLVLLSAFLHATWNFGAKKVSGNLAVFWIGLWVGSVALLPFAWRDFLSAPLPAESWGRMVLTGTLNALYFWLLARAYRKGDLSFIYPITRGCGVAGGAALGKWLLGESVSLPGAAGIAAVCLGTMAVGFGRRRHSDSNQNFPLALLIGAVLAVSAWNDKRAMGVSPTGAYLFAEWFLSALLLTPFLLRTRRAECLEAWRRKRAYCLLIGIGSTASYGLVLLAYRMGPLSYVLPARELAVVIGTALGVVWLREPLTFFKGVGIAAITTGLVLLKLA